MNTVGALVKKHVFHCENIAYRKMPLPEWTVSPSLCMCLRYCLQLLDKTRAPAYHTEDSKSSARKNEPFWQILSITSYQVEYSFTGNEMNEHDQQFEWFSFLDYYHLTPPRNDLSRAGADWSAPIPRKCSGCEEFEKNGQDIPQEAFMHFVSLNSNFKPL